MMPIYLLGSRKPNVEIPNQPLSISISGSVDQASLCIDAGEGQDVVRINAHLVIVPVLTGELTVRVEPIGAPTFSHDTVVYLAVGPDSPGEVDPVQVSFDPINLSGASAMEIAALTPRGGRIQVAARAVTDVPLSPLASMARTAARRSGGNRPPRHDGSLSIGVDTSASMRQAFADGSVGAAIDVVVGVADVAGIRDVTAMLVGARVTPVDASTVQLAQAVTRTPVRWSAGARWSQLRTTGRTIALSDSLRCPARYGLATVCVCGDIRLRRVSPLLTPPPAGSTAEQHLTANPILIDEVATALLPVLT